jgi:hypothetical protein
VQIVNGAGSGADAATGVAVDSSFNVYVCGYTVNSSSKEALTVRRLDSAGTQILVHVQANFANGEHINDCQTITLASSTTAYSIISSEIRGNINDGSTDYVINIYVLN